MQYEFLSPMIHDLVSAEKEDWNKILESKQELRDLHKLLEKTESYIISDIYPVNLSKVISPEAPSEKSKQKVGL